MAWAFEAIWLELSWNKRMTCQNARGRYLPKPFRGAQHLSSPEVLSPRVLFPCAMLVREILTRVQVGKLWNYPALWSKTNGMIHFSIFIFTNPSHMPEVRSNMKISAWLRYKHIGTKNSRSLKHFVVKRCSYYITVVEAPSTPRSGMLSQNSTDHYAKLDFSSFKSQLGGAKNSALRIRKLFFFKNHTMQLLADPIVSALEGVDSLPLISIPVYHFIKSMFPPIRRYQVSALNLFSPSSQSNHLKL